MGRAWVLGCAVLAGCSAADAEGIAPVTPPVLPRQSAPVGAIESPPGAGFTGDAKARELEILDATFAEVDDDFLLSLPGSSGLFVDAAADLIPAGGRSVGTPQDGTLRQGIALPANPRLYTRRHPSRSYGSTQTVRTIQTALATLRRDKAVQTEVMIGDISLPGGGPISPHVSHQSGRDIDIRLPLARGWDRTTVPVDAAQVDWTATWKLVESFLETGTVTYVFLDFQRQAELRAAALASGVHRIVADRWFQWPHPGGAGMIRHEDGHRAHVHIRLRCGRDEAACSGS